MSDQPAWAREVIGMDWAPTEPFWTHSDHPWIWSEGVVERCPSVFEKSWADPKADPRRRYYPHNYDRERAMGVMWGGW